MIRIDRRAVPAPELFESNELRQHHRLAARFFVRPRAQGPQRKFDWSPTMTTLRVALDPLRTLFNGKCAFCETAVRPVEGEFSHFRPTEGAMDHAGSVSTVHYWWLAFDWRNCLHVCPECARSKGKRFPVRKRRAKVDTVGAKLRREEPLLLDPCDDDPNEHFVFAEEGTVGSLTERGRISIEILSLNRSALVGARRDRIAEARRDLVRPTVRLTIPAAQNLVDTYAGSTAPFAGAVRQMLRLWITEIDSPRSNLLARALTQVVGEVALARSRSDIEAAHRSDVSAMQAQEGLSVDETSEVASKAYFGGARRIERVEMKNFRGIRALSCEMPRGAEREGWLVLLGENGCGKSTILQGIALALMGQRQVDRMGLVARDFFNRDAGNREDEGFVRVTLTNVSTPVELRFSKYSRKFTVTPPTELVLLMGYGATRLLPPPAARQRRQTRYVRCKNLFNPSARLQDAEAWLTDPRRVSPKRFHRIARALKELLMLGTRDALVRRRSRVYVRQERREHRLSELSDGFQSVIALAMDIIIGVQKWDDVAEAEAVVLIDELETHLHPRWKMEIVSRLRRAFPRMLFVATTHDPLCLRGLDPGEIVVMRRDTKGVHASVVKDSIQHLRADQLLTSPLFGLVGTRDPVAVRQIEEDGSRYDTLFRSQRSTAEEVEFKELGERLRSVTPSGETRGETEFLEARAEFLKQVGYLQLAGLPTISAHARGAGKQWTSAQRTQLMGLLDRSS